MVQRSWNVKQFARGQGQPSTEAGEFRAGLSVPVTAPGIRRQSGGGRTPTGWRQRRGGLQRAMAARFIW